MKKQSFLTQFGVLSATSLLLVACGGGGSSSNTDTTDTTNTTSSSSSGTTSTSSSSGTTSSSSSGTNSSSSSSSSSGADSSNSSSSSGADNTSSSSSSSSGSDTDTNINVNTSSDSARNHSYPVAYQVNGFFFGTGNRDNAIKIWSAGNTTSETILTGHTDWVHALAFSPDAQTLASAGRDTKINLWKNNQLQASLSGHSNWVYTLAFSRDAKTLLSAGAEGLIYVWDIETLQIKTRLSGHTGTIYALEYSPDGAFFASAGIDGIIRIWNSSTNELVASLQGHTAPIYALAFSPDGLKLASASEDATVKIWQLSDYSLQETLTGHTGAVYTVDFSADGRWLATAGQDKDVRLWDFSTPSRLSATRDAQRTLTGHTNAVTSLTFSPRGNHFISSGEDNTLKRWDAETGARLDNLTASGTEVSLPPPIPVEVAKDVSGLAFRAMNPIFNIRLLLNQPSQFSQALAAGVPSSTGVACPTNGNFGYSFTDTDNDKKYETAGDSFEVNANVCEDNGTITSGRYTLSLTQNLTTTHEESSIQLNNLSVTLNGKATEFNGNVAVTKDDNGTQEISDLTSSTLNLDDTNSEPLSFSSLTAKLTHNHSTSDEKELLFNGELSVLSGDDQGNYQIETLSAFKLSPIATELYPYEGKIEIKALSGNNAGITSTATVVDANTISVETDGNSITYNWSDLSGSFK